MGDKQIVKYTYIDTPCKIRLVSKALHMDHTIDNDCSPCLSIKDAFYLKESGLFDEIWVLFDEHTLAYYEDSIAKDDERPDYLNGKGWLNMDKLADGEPELVSQFDVRAGNLPWVRELGDNIMEYRGYVGSVEFSGRTTSFYGTVQGIDHQIFYEGQSAQELTDNFHAAVDEYLDECAADGIEPEAAFFGGFFIRCVPLKLYNNAVTAALARRMSLNDFLIDAVRKVANAADRVPQDTPCAKDRLPNPE